MIDPCIFSYISSIIFIIGILAYSYLLYVDKNEEKGTRTQTETIWIWGLYILLFMGLFVSLYCYVPVDKLSLEFSERLKRFRHRFNSSPVKVEYGVSKDITGLNFRGKRILGRRKRILKDTPITTINL